MNILLTGATGFLGSSLLRRMLDDGHSVSALKRSSSSLSRIEDAQKDVVFFDSDLHDYEEVFSSVNFDAVVNTACCYGRGGESVAGLLEANLLVGVKLLQCCAERNIPFINTGSYLNPFVNEYALSKSQLEQWMDYYSKFCKMITIKPDYMYGPGDHGKIFLVGKLLASFADGAHEINLSAGEQTRDLIHVDDVVDIFIRVLGALNKLQSRTEIVVGSGHEISIRDLVLLLRKIWQNEMGKECMTKFNFGVLPYRDHEIMRTLIDPIVIAGEPWQAKVKLEAGLKGYVRWFMKENTEKK